MMIGNRPKEASVIKLFRPYVWFAIERPLYFRLETGWNVCEIAFIFPIKEADDTEVMTADHYNGFVWRFAFWFPLARI